MASRVITRLFLAGLLGLGMAAAANAVERGGPAPEARGEMAADQNDDASDADGPDDAAPKGRVSADDHIRSVHSELKLTPDQEKLWPPVEAATRDLWKQREDEAAARSSRPRPGQDPVGALRGMADGFSARGDALRRFADAAAPLADTLAPKQRRHLVRLARPPRPEGDRHGGPRRGQR